MVDLDVHSVSIKTLINHKLLTETGIFFSYEDFFVSQTQTILKSEIVQRLENITTMEIFKSEMSRRGFYMTSYQLVPTIIEMF